MYMRQARAVLGTERPFCGDDPAFAANKEPAAEPSQLGALLRWC